MDTSNKFVLIHGKNISHNAMGAAAATPHMSIDKLFPALLECFGIIMCGYIAGRCGSAQRMISSPPPISMARGVNGCFFDLSPKSRCHHGEPGQGFGQLCVQVCFAGTALQEHGVTGLWQRHLVLPLERPDCQGLPLLCRSVAASRSPRATEIPASNFV